MSVFVSRCLFQDFFNAHNRLLPLASLDLHSHSALIVDVGAVLGHGYKVGANRSYDRSRIMHTMSYVRKGDVLKLYDLGSAKTFLGSVVVEQTEQLSPAAPMPRGWSKTQWVNRVHPDSLMLWRVKIGPCISPDTAAKPTRACRAGTELSTLVQIDRFASFGAHVRNCSFHDSCKTAAFVTISIFPADDDPGSLSGVLR